MNLFGIFKSRKLRDEEFVRERMKALAEGHNRWRLRSAVSTISSDEFDYDDLKMATYATVELVKAIRIRKNSKVEDATDRFMSGLFAIICASH